VRRSLFAVVVFTLAWAAQVLAPARANVAQAQGSDKFQRSLENCLKTGGAPAKNSRRFPGTDDGPRDACLVCQVCCAGVAPIEARLRQVDKTSQQCAVVAWMEGDGFLPKAHYEYLRQARAPPALS